jgi:hypothetical protein
VIDAETLYENSHQRYAQAAYPDAESEHEACGHGGIFGDDFLGDHHRDRKGRKECGARQSQEKIVRRAGCMEENIEEGACQDESSHDNGFSSENIGKVSARKPAHGSG